MNPNSTALPATRSANFPLWRLLFLGLPLIVATLFLIVWWSQLRQLANRRIETFGTVPAFNLTNQDDQAFGSTNLQGRIWIADFIFTTCQGPCPIISTRMAELMKPLASSDVQLVSFTVDPDKDTPPVLRAYAQKLNAPSSRWNFLTGPRQTIYTLSKSGFNLAAADGSDEEGTPVHSTRFILVDRNGRIRGYYDALAADGVTKLIADTHHLLREQPR